MHLFEVQREQIDTENLSREEKIVVILNAHSRRLHKLLSNRLMSNPRLIFKSMELGFDISDDLFWSGVHGAIRKSDIELLEHYQSMIDNKFNPKHSENVQSIITIFSAFVQRKDFDNAMEYIENVKEGLCDSHLYKLVVAAFGKSLSFDDEKEFVQEYHSIVSDILNLNFHPNQTWDDLSFSVGEDGIDLGSQNGRDDNLKSLWQFIWDKCGFIRGGVILQQLCVTLDDDHGPQIMSEVDHFKM